MLSECLLVWSRVTSASSKAVWISVFSVSVCFLFFSNSWMALPFSPSCSLKSEISSECVKMYYILTINNMENTQKNLSCKITSRKQKSLLVTEEANIASSGLIQNGLISGQTSSFLIKQYYLKVIHSRCRFLLSRLRVSRCSRASS